MIWAFLLGLFIGLFILVIYAAIVSGSKHDLEIENIRLRKELKVLKGGKG